MRFITSTSASICDKLDDPVVDVDRVGNGEDAYGILTSIRAARKGWSIGLITTGEIQTIPTIGRLRLMVGDYDMYTQSTHDQVHSPLERGDLHGRLTQHQMTGLKAAINQ